ncbi:sulfatase-like hydrolase/transferase [Cyclobacterium sp. 1_MG-2023]|uniref:sulfatase-like hydrolase/transferase n=1 Tax=Cyclobacterium sp. 1_MG-2023 TaxID=3062681 RepID=UPI0026E28E1A|nr:sulfatase-like hydrolase/transferase [Cyclobacterium sp. 1_MG-2023]MDO6438693.1 sulfatase-like hydrolase/transferase [Cyclobacterium sp. 1_MG-2023]
MKVSDYRLVIIFLTIIATSCNTKEKNESKPNILLLLSDDHQADLINALGNPYIKTPSLDKLVQEGTTFTQAFTETPTCVPSRASLLTGSSSLTHNSFFPRYSGSGNESLQKWPQTMKDNGYTTFWTGKWNAYGKPEKWGIDILSRISYGGMGSHTKTFEENDSTITGFSSELYADAAIRFLNEKQSSPFFLTVAFTAPHDPRTPPQEYKEMYSPMEVPLPANFYSEYPYEDGYKTIRDEKLLPFPRNVDSVRNEIALYYGMISHMDTQIGRILKTLDDNGLEKNTIVIYASDNGLAIGHHGLLGKMSFYRHSLNVPLIIRGEGISENVKTDAYVYLSDLYPTICDIVGIEIPKTVETKSFLPILKGDSTIINEFMFGALSDLKRSVTSKKYKLIRHYRSEERPEGTDEYLFYDIKNDPLEIVNQVENVKFSEEISKLKIILANWQKEKNDFLPSEFD